MTRLQETITMAMLTLLLLLSAAFTLGDRMTARIANDLVTFAADQRNPCPRGWFQFNSRCFMFVKTARTWPNAEDRLWFWSDGSKFDHESWAEGEPNNHNGAREPCIQINFGAENGWNDESCGKSYPSVCSIRTCLILQTVN
ncbi:ladderlectin-like isoform X2 [Oncorhynchus tshawytscha]|uniref:ladderlectin-like isoform X2 n=1 Tax=Oncorhynchus tshawytscha TaxID=74940 RepID=UPI001C3D26F0|nr:ladderlectin-like isoform X2 [Oncorhynchus tshawytscha]XP_042184642.1 ladderlectin-like isoform X2 [Oncorhynchus tshawytscha]XP_042184644.1 ladderlectin-like isoform X2 [Oncorhynchus tshawytscha]